MAEERVSRRLAAILAADIAGYSRLMGEDEPATVRALKSHQGRVLPLVGEYGGRIIDTAGDGILAEFPSVVAAVECAVKIQAIMAADNRDIPESRRMQYRIGINLGDVIHDETRIYGDGINVAARLEAIAEPGGICISSKVYDDIVNKVALHFRDLGEMQLKNIARPVRVYALADNVRGSDASAAVGPMGSSASALVSRRPNLVAALVAAVVIAGIAAAGLHQRWFLPAQPIAEQVASGPLVKSIAILPFQRLDAKTPEDEFLGIGLADALITNLSNVHQIVVRPTSSVIRYSGANPALWAGRFDEDFSDLFRMQDSIAEQVTRALVVNLTKEQRNRVSRSYPKNVKAYQLYLQGRFFWNKFNEEGFRKAIAYFEDALKIDPDYALAYVGISHANSAMVAIGAQPYREGAMRAKQASARAVALDEELAEAHEALGGNNILLDWDWAGGERELKRAMELNPNLAEAHSLYGYYLQAMGRSQEALTITRETYAEAIQRCERELKEAKGAPGTLAPLAFALASAGRLAVAARTIEELKARSGKQRFPPSLFALAYAGLGDREKALQWLETAYREHDTQLLWFRLEPQMDSLRADPRFQDVMRKMGLVNP